jgi:hypothetical protein
MAPSAPAAPRELVSGLLALMEAGVSPWRRPWDPTRGPQARLFSGRPYRGGNPALLCLGQQLRGAPLPWWCSRAEARVHGLVLRRGSEGIPLLRSRGQGAPPKPLVVFNVADLRGPGLQDWLVHRRRQLAQGAGTRQQRWAAAAVLAPWPWPDDRPRDEIPLTSWIQAVIGPSSQAREALVAELGALLLGERLRIGNTGPPAAADLEAWIDLLAPTPSLFDQLLAEACRAADRIAPEWQPGRIRRGGPDGLRTSCWPAHPPAPAPRPPRTGGWPLGSR